MKIPKILSKTLHPFRNKKQRNFDQREHLDSAADGSGHRVATPLGESIYSNPSSEGTQQESRGARAALGHLVPPPGPATRVAGAMETLKSLGRVQRTPSVIISAEADLKEILQIYADTKSKGHAISRGIVEVNADGNLRIDDSLAIYVSEIIDSQKRDRKIPLKKVHRDGMVFVPISHLNAELIDGISLDNRFKKMVLGLCMPGKVRVSVRNSEGAEIDWPEHLTSRKKVYVRGMDGSEKRITEKSSALVSAATALTIRCLAEENYRAAARIAGRIPEVVLKEICQLPIHGNIFTRAAIVEIVRTCTAVSTRKELTPHAIATAKEALSRSLMHYFKYSPVLGLSVSVNTKLAIIMGRDKNADLLVQNHNLFLQEMRHLVTALLEVSPNSKYDSDALRDSGYHVAELMGHAFLYLSSFSEKLAGDQADLKRREQEIASVINAVVLTGLENSPSPAGVDGIFELSAATFFDKISKWLSQSEADLDLESLAKNLGKMTEAIMTNARSGLMVPGDEYLSTERFKELSAEDKTDRLRSGEQFATSYASRLKEFGRGELEKSASVAAEQPT